MEFSFSKKDVRVEGVLGSSSRDSALDSCFPEGKESFDGVCGGILGGLGEDFEESFPATSGVK